MIIDRFSAIAVFCDDVREEIQGSVTLVGIFPDNLTVAQMPSALPKISVYTRIQFDPEHPPKEVRSFLRLPWEPGDIGHNSFGSELIEQGRTSAIAEGNILVGMVGRISAAAFAVPRPGRILAMVAVDGVEHVAGTLNIRHEPSPV